jgi:hypothetical protein
MTKRRQMVVQRCCNKKVLRTLDVREKPSSFELPVHRKDQHK